MGNKCCGKKHLTKERHESSNPALQAIREAQRKYFNSHIESDLDDSEEEDSTDGLYDSESDLVNAENDSFETLGLDSSVVGESTTIIQSTITTTENPTSPILLRNGSYNNLDNGGGTTITTTTTTIVKKDKNAEESQDKPAVVKRRNKAKYIRLSKRGHFFSIFNTEDKKARSVDPKMYQYPFENIVFEGGGNKGLAYCGAVRLLEELNIWPQIKRLAGTSAGAMTAALLAVGYSSHDLEQFFSLNLNKIFLDHKFGYLSLLPNLVTSYGWNPGKRIYKWFGQRIYEKTGDMDTTFKEVYERFDRELCIVVTNLNQMTSLYCHPKTTPDMPVRLAVRMSISIPGMFQAVKHTVHGQTDVFVDGGVLCNYPIHCFDGWWLSMKPEDNFLEKLQPLEDIPRLLERTERFGTYNEKTLGMQLYSDNEQDLLKYQLENLRHGVQLQELPNTKLAREKIRKKKLQLKTDREHRRLVKAMNSFLRALNKHNADRNDTIDREELNAALNDETLFPRKRRLILFGDVDSDVILDYLDRDHNGQISYNELLSFMEETGISMQNRFLGYQRRNIMNFPSFLETLQATLLTNVKRVYVEERDLKRTVGINTGHVGTSDFVLEPADIEFVLERGRRSLEAFLKYYVATNHIKKRPEYRRLNEELRKDSLTSSGSNASFGSANSVTLPPASCGTSGIARVPSPLAAGGRMREAVDSTARPAHGELLVPSGSTHPHGIMRTRPSGRSVSISDKVEVMDERGRYGSSGSAGPKIQEDDDEEEEEDNEQEEEVDEEDEDAEVDEHTFLVGGSDEDDTKHSHKDKSGHPPHKHHENVPSSGYVKSTGSTSSQNFSKDKRSVSEEGPRKSSLKVDVQVHQSLENPDSSSSPLLQDSDMNDTSNDSIELQDLALNHREGKRN